jgi:multidrug efflux system membrane fusion protein
VEFANAAIRSDKAAIENAKLDLGYCTIRSPMDGRTGNLLVHRGNIVKANENPPLVVITQIQPISWFFVPEQHLTTSNDIAAGNLGRGRHSQEAVGRGYSHFVVISIDHRFIRQATFTIRKSWPGQFVVWL